MTNMQRLLKVFTLLLLVQACSSIKVSQDYDATYTFSNLNTFAWKENKDKEYGIKDNDLVDNRIRTAIVSHLYDRSFNLIESKTPDFYISYHVSIKQNYDSGGSRTGFSFGISSFGSHGGIGISTGSSSRAYNEGTLLIDVTDPSTNKLIWRGISTQPVSDHTNPSESISNIDETVNKILTLFPPEK